MTDRAKYRFRVKEFSGGKAWIALEPFGSEIPALKNAVLGFDLSEGTTLQEAEKICGFLNDNIVQVNYTKVG
jgi:hypothetical protein